MSYDLCLLPQAKKPYYIENIRMNIYSLEELCFYLYNNACLIDESLLNERLLDWLRDELGLTRLYRQLYDQLEKKDGIGFLVLPIFREAGYLTTSAMREYQEQLQKLEVQSSDMKQKLRGDYLVKERMYGRAVSEYRDTLKRENVYSRGVSGGKGTHAQERSERSRKGSEGAVLQKYKNMRLAYRERIMYTLGVCKRKQGSQD